MKKMILFSLSCLIGGIVIGLSFNAYAQESSSIPNWIKSTTKLWINGDVNDDDFEKEIQYLIEHKIIKISQIQQNSQSIQRVPHWVKNLAGMWVNGTSSNDDFTKAIEYMVNVGIITVNVPSTLTNTQNQTTVHVQNQTTSPPISSVTTMINQTNNSSTSLNSLTPTNNLPSLLGSGISLKIINNTASGYLTLNGKHYDAPSLTIVIKGDEITLTGYVQGSFNVLLMTTGVHTSGISYNFNGAIMNNGNSVPVTFIASLTNPAKLSATNVMPAQNIQSSQNVQSKPAPGIPMLMLTTHNDQVYMAYPYNLVVKIFDPQTNPQKIFVQFTGGISNVNITTIIVDPNNKIIGQSIGKTDSKGIYQAGITMPYTEWQQEQLQVMINATKKGYATQSTTLPLLLIHPNSGSAPVCSVSTSSLPDGTNGVAYSQTLSSSSCSSPVTWSPVGAIGSSGLTLSSSGLISGTPVAGTYSLVVTVTSSDGRTATASLSIKIN